MEKPLYPSKNMRITQGYNEGTHRSSFAIDDAGKDTGIEKIYAPFTGTIKKIYTQDANEVWLESVDKVEYPDGTKDFMTIMFAHCNDVSNLFVGKRITKGDDFYSEGTKGNATGNHCHIECGKGKFTGTGWYKNASGFYSINNAKKPEECLWIDESIKVLNDRNYNFKSIKKEVVEPPKTPPKEEEKQKPKEEVKKEETSTKKLIYTCKKTDIYGIYLKDGQKVYIED